MCNHFGPHSSPDPGNLLNLIFGIGPDPVSSDLRRVLETAFEKVLRRVLRRCLPMCFLVTKGSEKGSILEA